MVTSRSRASTTLSSRPAVIRATASATAAAHCGRRERAVGEGHVDRRRPAPAAGRPSACPARPARPAPARRRRSSARRRRRACPRRPRARRASPPAADVGGVGHRAERHRSGAREVDLVAHDRAAHQRRSTTTPARRCDPARMPCGRPRAPSPTMPSPRRTHEHTSRGPPAGTSDEQRRAELGVERHGARDEGGGRGADRVDRRVACGQRGHRAAGYDPPRRLGAAHRRVRHAMGGWRA